VSRSRETVTAEMKLSQVSDETAIVTGPAGV